jgi:hypothetical protein
MRSAVVWSVVVCVLVGVAGCQGPSTTEPTPAVTPTPPAVAASSLPDGKMVASKSTTNAVPMTATGMKVDGVLDEPAWKDATAMGDFVLGRADKAPVQSRVLLTADADTLYLAVINDEPNTDKLVMNTKDREGPVWEDDCIEVYLDPNADRGEYFGFFVNAGNVVYDRRRDEGWTAPWTSAVKVIKDKAWVVEMAIPWKSLEVTGKAGLKFGLMVARDRKAGLANSQGMYLVPCNDEAKDTDVYPVFELK